MEPGGGALTSPATVRLVHVGPSRDQQGALLRSMCSLREEQESLGALDHCKSDRLEALLTGPSPTHLLMKLVLVELVPINLVLMKLVLVELVLVKNNRSWWNWSWSHGPSEPVHISKNLPS